jgi:hypothetical protein
MLPLQSVIYQAVRARIGWLHIHTGRRLGAFTQDDGGITSSFFARNRAHRATALQLLSAGPNALSQQAVLLMSPP